jgi:hypothetical protein
MRMPDGKTGNNGKAGLGRKLPWIGIVGGERRRNPGPTKKSSRRVHLELEVDARETTSPPAARTSSIAVLVPLQQWLASRTRRASTWSAQRRSCDNSKKKKSFPKFVSLHPLPNPRQHYR